MIHEKLVRDLIPQIIEDGGNEAVTRILENDEYYQALKDKLKEETEEYLESEDPEELADILEVIRALVDYHSMTYEDLETTRQMKLDERGGFTEKVFLIETVEN